MIAVIAGATSPVGRAAARVFANERHHVALLGRNLDGLAAAAADVASHGRRGLPVVCDMRDPASVEAAVARIERELGQIDVWVNVAQMPSSRAPVSGMSPEDFERASTDGFLPVVNGTLRALERMRARNRGTIVQVGSAMSYRALPLHAPAGAAMHAIKGFTQSLHAELLHDNSHVCVSMVQLPEDGSLEAAARAILYAARFGPRELNVGARTVASIWADRLAAGITDRLHARSGYRRTARDTDVRASVPRDDAVPSQVWLRTHPITSGAALAASVVLAAVARTKD